MPVESTSQYGGIFQNVLQINGTPQQQQQVQSQLAEANADVAIIYQALKMLPEGGLKEWLTANPVQFWTKVIQLFTGRKYTSDQYVLGERFHDQILGGDVSRSQVPDDMVAQAQTFFTIVFGVRITTGQDLDALDYGPQTYYNRGEKDDVPYEAVERAVYLKQHYYPISTYNQVKWETKWFEVYPLVAAIPGTDQGALYTGPLPGGASAINGLIPVDAASLLKQFPNAKFDPVTGDTTTAAGEVIHPTDTTAATAGGIVDKLKAAFKANPAAGILTIGALAYIVMEGDL